MRSPQCHKYPHESHMMDSFRWTFTFTVTLSSPVARIRAQCFWLVSVRFPSSLVECRPSSWLYVVSARSSVQFLFCLRLTHTHTGGCCCGASLRPKTFQLEDIHHRRWIWKRVPRISAHFSLETRCKRAQANSVRIDKRAHQFGRIIMIMFIDFACACRLVASINGCDVMICARRTTARAQSFVCVCWPKWNCVAQMERKWPTYVCMFAHKALPPVRSDVNIRCGNSNITRSHACRAQHNKAQHDTQTHKHCRLAGLSRVCLAYIDYAMCVSVRATGVVQSAMRWKILRLSDGWAGVSYVSVEYGVDWCAIGKALNRHESRTHNALATRVVSRVAELWYNGCRTSTNIHRGLGQHQKNIAHVPEWECFSK